MSSNEDSFKDFTNQRGLIDSILNGWGMAPQANLKNYQTPLDMKQLMSLLQGQQGRDLGLAGRQAGAQASAYGLNPSSAVQRAQSGIYGDYAKQFTDIPFRLGQYNLQQFAPILQLLGLRGGTLNQMPDNSSDIGSLLGSLGSAAITKFSDRRLKKNIRSTGLYYHNLPVYRYQYLWDDRDDVGVMAQDVELIYPEAVSELFGYKRVDYSRI